MNGTKQSQCLGTAGRILSANNSPTHQIKNDAVNKRNYHEVTGDIICPSMVMGIDHLRDPRLNKVMLNQFYLKYKFIYV